MVELINVNKQESPGVDYPVCLRSEGIGPSQYGVKGLVNEKLAEIEEKYDLNNSVLLDEMSREGEEEEEEEPEEEEKKK